jgi:hypothetical protein
MPQGNISSGIYDLPQAVSDEGTQPELWGATVGSHWLPTEISVPPDPPVFRTQTEQLDLLRVAMLLVGVFIGAKVLR